MTAPDVKIADLYLRLSDLREVDLNEDGRGKTFQDRENKLRDLADRLGYTVGLVVVENDEIEKVRMVKGQQTKRKVRGASAFKRRKVVLPDGSVAWRVFRPGFRKILDRLNSKQSHALLAEDLDRTMRDPRDLEDFIDVARAHRVNARSLSGSLTFTDGGTDSEIMSARIAVVVANKSSADTARRVADSRLRRASNGEFGGGRRPFGFEADGITQRPEECAVIAHCSARVLQIDGSTRKGQSLRSLAAELRNAVEELPEGFIGPPRHLCPTVTGAEWSAETLRDILLRPRNAGLMVYKGEILEDAPCPWEPIVSRRVFDAVVRTLTDPSRRTHAGATPKYLGTNLYRCGKCTPPGTAPKTTKTMHVRANRGTYRCSTIEHLSCDQEALDAHVVAHVLSLLSLPNAAELFLPAQPDVDVDKLRAEADALRVRLTELAETFAEGLINRTQLAAGTERLNAKLDGINRQLTSAVVESPLAGLANRGVDVLTWWEKLPLANKRVVIDSLVTITVMPTKTRRGFDPERIVIDEKNKNTEVAA